jgi:anti-sigma B factor antagonist
MTGRTVLALTGEIDFLTAEAWSEAIGAALLDGPSTLVLDMGAVAFIDSTGLGMLVDTRSRCQRGPTTLELSPVSVAVRNLLHLAGLETVFAVEPA